MAHGFIKFGIFLFFVLSVSIIVIQTDDFFKNITGNVMLSENVIGGINETIEEVIIVLKIPLEEEYSVNLDKSEKELEEDLEIIREEIIED